VKIRLGWKRKAIIAFSGLTILLSVILTILAIREAERGKLVKEKEIKEEQARTAQLLIDQVRAIVSEAEERIIRSIRNDQISSQEIVLKETCRRIAEEEEITDEIFIINAQGRMSFPLIKPLYFLQGEGEFSGKHPIEIEADFHFKRAGTCEFRTKNYHLAIESYKKLMNETSDIASWAILLNCIGRCYIKSGKNLKALEAYRKILKKYPDEISSDGIPFGLLARYQIGTINGNMGKKIEEVEAFLELYSNIFKSKWQLKKDRFYFYRNKIRKTIESALVEIRETNNNENLIKEWEKLEKIEEQKLGRMNTLENLAQRIAPLIEKKNHAPRTLPGIFAHFCQEIEEEVYMISYTYIDEKVLLGMKIDIRFLAANLLPKILERFPLKEDWHIQIRDESGDVVAGKNIWIQEKQSPSLAFSKSFEENFLPWNVNILQDNPSEAGRKYILRRNIYILFVAALVMAILLGGFLAIRITAKEFELAKLKSEFVSTVSHDFRTPLTSIRYLAELLKRGRIKEETKKQLYYETITDETDRLSRLVENILDFSKIEADMKEYRFEKTDIAQLARDVASRFQKQVVGKKFILITEIPKQMPKVSADKEAISRALFNMLDNALKYRGQSQRANLRAWSDRENVFLEVEDKGIGISKEEQKKVFDRFYRSDRAYDDKIRGSGIGLGVVSHIIKAHKGEVKLESERGIGTKVTLKIPLKGDMDKNG